MSDPSLTALLRLMRAQSFVEARVDPGLGAVHGLSLREFMFLMQLDQAPLNRLRRVDVANRLNVSQSTVTRMALIIIIIAAFGFYSASTVAPPNKATFIVPSQSVRW